MQTYVGIGADLVGGLVKDGIQNIMNNFLHRLVYFDSDLVITSFLAFFKFLLI